MDTTEPENVAKEIRALLKECNAIKNKSFEKYIDLGIVYLEISF